MLNCREVAERLVALQETDDAVLDSDAMEGHLSGCAACRALASNLLSTRELLQRTVPPAVVADDTMLRRIESAIFDSLGSRPKKPRRPRLHLIHGAAGQRRSTRGFGRDTQPRAQGRCG